MQVMRSYPPILAVDILSPLVLSVGTAEKTTRLYPEKDVWQNGMENLSHILNPRKPQLSSPALTKSEQTSRIAEQPVFCRIFCLLQWHLTSAFVFMLR